MVESRIRQTFGHHAHLFIIALLGALIVANANAQNGVASQEFATGVSVTGDSAVLLVEHCTIDVTRPSVFPSTIVAGGVVSASGHLVVLHGSF